MDRVIRHESVQDIFLHSGVGCKEKLRKDLSDIVDGELQHATKTLETRQFMLCSGVYLRFVLDTLSHNDQCFFLIGLDIKITQLNGTSLTVPFMAAATLNRLSMKETSFETREVSGLRSFNWMVWLKVARKDESRLPADLMFELPGTMSEAMKALESLPVSVRELMVDGVDFSNICEVAESVVMEHVSSRLTLKWFGVT